MSERRPCRYQVGDRVIYGGADGCASRYEGYCATIVSVRGSFLVDETKTVYHIEFDHRVDEISDGIYSGHDCDGHARLFYGWNLPAADLVEESIDLAVDINSLI